MRVSIPILEARNITKTFPGVTALKNVSFDLHPGEIHALCGENGAGKSTLIKLLSGVHPYGSYEGELYIQGRPAGFYSVADAQMAGLAVIYQELALVPEMTAAENIFLGAEPTRNALMDWHQMYRQTRLLLDRFKLNIEPATPVRNLGIGQKQLIEIVKALRKNSRILILDEPTAALTERETEILLDTLRDLRRHGIGCIYISHRLEEVLAVADRVTVLRDGASVMTRSAGETDKKEIIRHMVGREIQDFFSPRNRPPGNVLLEVEDLTVADDESERTILKDISFELREGEVLGLGGLMGAGRTELLMHLFGAWGSRLRGRVTLRGEPLDGCLPEEALRRGLALATEDRRRYGLVLDHSIGFNLSLSSLSRYARHGLIDRHYEFAANKKQFDSLGVRAPGLEFPTGGLSGGNQQKIVLGKVLLAGPMVLLLDEPTRGIDVGAKWEMYRIIDRLTDEGKGVVLASSELPELLGMSDRILMLHEGAVGGCFSRHEATQENLVAAAMGHGEALR